MKYLDMCMKESLRLYGLWNCSKVFNVTKILIY